MGKHPSIVIGLFAMTVLALFFALFRPERHSLHLRCYLQNARGLRAGATVRVAGVEVGNVTSVRLRPELRDHPVEVLMLLRTGYELKIPNDSVVILRTAGVLGDVFPEINLKNATGPPVQDGGELKSGE